MHCLIAAGRLAPLGLLSCMLGAAGPVTAAPPGAHDPETQVLYVSTAGDDRWSGRLTMPAPDGLDGPFATLSAARDELRRRRAGNALSGAAVVMVLEGTYHLQEPFVLTAEDSGTERQPITYTAYPGHHPVLSGARVIAGWKPFRDKILQAYLPDVEAGSWRFRQLFFRGQRQTRARWPDADPADPLYSGWAFIEAAVPADAQGPARYRYAAGQAPRPWAHPAQAEVEVFPWYCWVNDLLPLKSMDSAARTFTLARESHCAWMPLVAGNRFYVENVLEELDQPGEWCLRTDTGALYFWPPDELRPGDVMAPVLDTLVELRGSAAAPVRQVTVSGLTFSHTLSPFPEHLHASFHAPTGRGAGILLRCCADCRVEDNRLVMLGGDGVRLEGESTGNTVAGNEIGYVGGSGVTLADPAAAGTGGDTPQFADQNFLRRASEPYPRVVNNTISDNDIHHCNQLKKWGGAVHLYGVNSVGTVIAHNRMAHLPDKAVNLQDGFGKVTVEYNDIYRVALEIADTGAIMANRWFVLVDDPGLSTACTVRFNRIRECVGCGAYSEARHPKGEGDRTVAGGRIWTPYYTWGIYFDNSGMENTIFGNIVVGSVLGGVGLPVGAPRNNRVDNNILAGHSGNQLDLRLAGANNRFSRNILSYADPQARLFAVGPDAKTAIAECDENLYHLASGDEPRIRGSGSLQEWRALGFDQHSVVADPLFVDAAAGDYRLRPESPAFALGFKAIPVDEIGPRPRARPLSHE
jgi:hypothetical protein